MNPMNSCEACKGYVHDYADTLAKFFGGYSAGSEQRVTFEVTVSKEAWYALVSMMMYFDKTSDEVVSDALISYNDGGLCF